MVFGGKILTIFIDFNYIAYHIPNGFLHRTASKIAPYSFITKRNSPSTSYFLLNISAV